jgi:hypothetical protein
VHVNTLNRIKLSTLGALSVILFLIYPYLAIIFLFFALVLLKNVNKNLAFIYFTFLALFLGFINSTKMLESDLQTYYEQFKLIKNASLLEFLLLNGKEPGFYIFKYIAYYVVSGDFKLYLIVFTFISYFVLFVAIYRMLTKLNMKLYIVFAVTIIAFFGPYFSLSAHLMRQFFAASFLLYFIVEKVFYQKSNWVILFFVVLCHTTTLLFVPLVFLKVLDGKINLKRIAIIIPVVVLISFFYIQISMVLAELSSGYPMISYVFERSGEVMDKNDGDIGIIGMSLLIFLLLLSLWRIYLYKSVQKTLVKFLNIFIFFAVFIIMILNQPLLSLRFFFYVYAFIPFILFVNVPVNNVKFYICSFFASICLLGSFGYFIDNGSWSYSSFSSIISFGLWSLI